MKIFRKNIKNVTNLVIWFLFSAFFADVVNLDDYISSINVIHTDCPADSEFENPPIQPKYLPNEDYLTFSTVHQQYLTHLKSIYDQDSPSIISEVHSINKVQFTNLLDKKLSLNSFFIIKDIYLEQRSLLI